MNNLKRFGVENRPIISGNFTKQPALKKYNLVENKKFPKADIVDNLGFMIGLSYKKISEIQLKRLKNSFFNSFKNVN